MSNPAEFVDVPVEFPDVSVLRTAVSSPYLHKMQKRHFLLFDVLPFIGTGVAVGLLFYQPIGAVEIGLFFVMWLLTGLAITVGFHRLFTHRAFRAHTAVRVALTIFGCMAARGPMVSWAAMHRRHHQLADHPGDMHSPNMHGRGTYGRLRGWLHAHLTWMWRHEYPNLVYYVPDLLKDRPVMRANRRYYTWVVLGLAIPAALGGILTASWMGVLTGFLWGGVVRMFVIEQSMNALNSFLHLFGPRPFPMLDNHSHNNAVLGFLVLGEGWHNNHNAFPDSAAFGLKWYQLDPGYWLVRLLATMGLVWDVRLPSPERIIARKAALTKALAEAT